MESRKKTHLFCSNEPFFLKCTCVKYEKKTNNQEEAKTKDGIIHMHQLNLFFTGKGEPKKKRKRIRVNVTHGK